MTQSEFEGRVIAITGGSGTLCTPMARALAEKGACVALLQRNLARAEKLAAEISAGGGRAVALKVDVSDKPSVEAAADRLESEFGRVDALINGAGGNSPLACTSAELSLFDVNPEAIKAVVDVNLLGTMIACQVFGKIMVKQDRGVILNIASAASVRPLTGSIAYAPAKAAVASYTQWLAVHLSTEYSPRIRVNAILPGFFVADHNRHRLIDADTGALTPRSRAIMAHTPMRRFGNPEELVGAVMWLLSDSASFVHGALIPVDGGFLAFAGV
jgi:NAD(P)-dependent dehydrogenase (short-subunit alcohol dehydrogenase family)